MSVVKYSHQLNVQYLLALKLKNATAKNQMLVSALGFRAVAFRPSKYGVDSTFPFQTVIMICNFFVILESGHYVVPLKCSIINFTFKFKYRGKNCSLWSGYSNSDKEKSVPIELNITRQGIVSILAVGVHYVILMLWQSLVCTNYRCVCHSKETKCLSFFTLLK